LDLAVEGWSGKGLDGGERARIARAERPVSRAPAVLQEQREQNERRIALMGFPALSD